ncbi:helix-turn-helix domain-containing protein [Clostridium perfringens]|uniref:helix-turn-helix domain-containing protein n=1 Tax=Clostridium perfringens TaxID=1502 RepID=UPI001ABBA6EC|nr:helix-turn-helix domain-containing protein [Clostridium perfringens]MBO3304595.1 helix-turn-helix domain-containing protein [Clostridium perfringens]MBO3307894.1 helix-turn-helix domain-containing protein [Clostridium perfringens]MBO3311243.1 helix-turn-helix domain-containing protein [Clostridium perfringens]MBO3317592.1 helix-turn-helix domain-containing protein [Clostridium perfringens]MBO3392708.1 helix-turn-helix domain-containing protein [Clostridium perfringens]
MKTAQEVANELNISRSDVYNLLRKKRFSSLVQKKGGQVAISNKLFNLLKEEIKHKRSLNEIEKNKTINTTDIKKSETKKNTPINEKQEKENFNFNPIEILKNQIALKDNQITILNNVITNNLNRISELESKQQDFKNLSEELETLKATLNDLTKRKNKKRVLGLF